MLSEEDKKECERLEDAKRAWRAEQDGQPVLRRHERADDCYQYTRRGVGFRLIRGFNLMKGGE